MGEGRISNSSQMLYISAKPAWYILRLRFKLRFYIYLFMLGLSDWTTFFSNLNFQHTSIFFQTRFWFLRFIFNNSKFMFSNILRETAFRFFWFNSYFFVFQLLSNHLNYWHIEFVKVINILLWKLKFRDRWYELNEINQLLIRCSARFK